MSGLGRRLVFIGLGALVVLMVVLLITDDPDADPTEGALADTTTTSGAPALPAPTTSIPRITEQTTTTAPSTTTTSTTPSTTTTTAPYPGLWNPADVEVPYGDTVEGLLTFRGSPTRTFYGRGPVPATPQVRWRFPDSGGLCSRSTTGGETTTWCGTGWTGQPAVWIAEESVNVAFGAYDRAVHILDAHTGERRLEDFPTGDIIKGSVTVDPDGYPLLYTGSRDGFLRVLALDRGEQMVELWKLAATAVSPTKWNNDWDGSPLVLDDLLLEGGENSQFHVVRLNRGYDADGLVTVDPELVFNAPGWDDELTRAVGNNVSIENSVAVSGNVVYFANSGGLVQGWDLTPLLEPETAATLPGDEPIDAVTGGGPVAPPTPTTTAAPPAAVMPTNPQRVFRFWAGDDIDASVVVDTDGALYVGVEYERGLDRAREVGQIVKLDPSRPEDPVVWSVDDADRLPGGIWGTPALHGEMLYVATDGGRLMGIDAVSGDIRWTKHLPGPLWQSPVVVDDVLVMGDCAGALRGFDVSTPGLEPTELWRLELGGCIESTPAVWDGWIYVGTRAGAVYGIADPGT